MINSMPDVIQIQLIGMCILLSWAVSNIIIGAIGWRLKKSVKMYFNQMNFFWNMVNLFIAIFALINIFQTNYELMSMQEFNDKQAHTEWLFLLNGFINFIYIAIGILLIVFSKRAKKRNDLLKGYGRSVILQGVFLLVFDFVMYDILHSVRTF
jgi:hypothetical protein